MYFRYLRCGPGLAQDSVFLKEHDASGDQTIRVRLREFDGQVDVYSLGAIHSLVAELMVSDSTEDDQTRSRGTASSQAFSHADAIANAQSENDAGFVRVPVGTAVGDDSAFERSPSMFAAFEANYWHQKLVSVVRMDSLAIRLVSATQQCVATLRLQDMLSIVKARSQMVEGRLLLGDAVIVGVHPTPMVDPQLASQDARRQVRLFGRPPGTPSSFGAASTGTSASKEAAVDTSGSRDDAVRSWQYPNRPLLGLVVQYASAAPSLSGASPSTPTNPTHLEEGRCSVRLRLGALHVNWVDAVIDLLVREIRRVTALFSSDTTRESGDISKESDEAENAGSNIRSSTEQTHNPHSSPAASHAPSSAKRIRSSAAYSLLEAEVSKLQRRLQVFLSRLKRWEFDAFISRQTFAIPLSAHPYESKKSQASKSPTSSAIPLFAHFRLEQCHLYTGDIDPAGSDHSASPSSGEASRGSAQLARIDFDHVVVWASAHCHLSWHEFEKAFRAAVRKLHVDQRSFDEARRRNKIASFVGKSPLLRRMVDLVDGCRGSRPYRTCVCNVPANSEKRPLAMLTSE